MAKKILCICTICLLLLLIIGCPEPQHGPQGTIDDPFLVYNATDLTAVSNNLTAHYKQMADIDLTSIDWVPIGTYQNPFKGTYNGNGFSISNMTITIEAQDMVEPIGLFGNVDDNQFCDVRLYGITLRNAHITQTDTRDPAPIYNGTIGLLAGKISDTSIENCTIIDGTINTPNHQWVGGIVGEAIQNCEITRSSVVGLTLTARKYAGGIAGLMGGSDIVESFVTGTLESTETYSSVGGEGAHIGGLVGYLNYNSSISDSYVDATITSDAQYIGGLVGRVVQGSSGCEITDSYGKGMIAPSESVWNNASGNKFYGGLFGYIDSNNAPVIEDLVYSTTFSTGATNQAAGGGDVSSFDMNAFTDDELMSQQNFEDEDVDWDFSDTWDIDPATNGGYPYLIHNPPQAT